MPKPPKKTIRRVARKAPKRSVTLDDSTLPTPIRKAVRKAKRMEQQTGKADRGVKLIAFDPTADFNTLIGGYMAQMGSKGGKVSGAKRKR